jgi:hypothetical protein
VSKPPDSLTDYALQALLAGIGGLIGSLTREEKGGWVHAVIGAMGAGFVGLIMAHGCHAMEVSDDLTFVIVGVSGWLGADKTIHYVERALLARFNLEAQKKSAQEETSAPTNVRDIGDVQRKKGQRK